MFQFRYVEQLTEQKVNTYHNVDSRSYQVQVSSRVSRYQYASQYVKDFLIKSAEFFVCGSRNVNRSNSCALDKSFLIDNIIIINELHVISIIQHVRMLNVRICCSWNLLYDHLF